MKGLEIFIDSREHGPRNKPDTRKERAIKYYTKKEHTALITQLEYGDYLFQKNNKTVAYEYKTINDYMQSVYNGSLFEEATNQTETYDYSYVIIEGTIENYIQETWNGRNGWIIKKKWNYKFNKFYERNLITYYGSLRRLRKFTCPIFCNSEEHCFFEMLQQSVKCFDNKVYGGVKRSVESQDNVSFYLSGCNGVSNGLIENINKTLVIDGLDDLMSLSVEDLMTVPLIGEVTAVKIYNWIHKKRGLKV